MKPVPHLICYRETSVEEIAATVGLPASGVYRYFGRKSDLLAASFRRAADWLSAELGSVASAASDPEEALTRVIDAYVARSFDRPELDYVYYTERLNMTKAARTCYASCSCRPSSHGSSWSPPRDPGGRPGTPDSPTSGG